MHALEVIVARNERAVAREAAHAFNDGDTAKFIAIREASDWTITHNYCAAYTRANGDK